MLTAVVDLSHWNASPDFAKIKAAGIVGVILKATQGAGNIDPTFRKRSGQAQDAGLLVGAYHFATGGDGVKQADWFLGVVGVDPDILRALDFEDNPVGPTMSIGQACDFVERVAEKAGKFPGFYSGHTIKRLIRTATDAQKDILSGCWLWIAQYGPKPSIIGLPWKTWSLWQFTDGAVGPMPHTVDGAGRCDIDKWNGDEAGLRRLWGAA